MPAFDVPPDARFTCQQCAGCCLRWHVYLTPAEHERLRAHDWAAESPRLAGRALFEELPGSGRGPSPTVRLAKIEGACAFLEPDQLCLIHKTMGLEAKPGPCQQYPFHFAGTPDGVAVSLDFACSAVLADEGVLLADDPAELTAAARAAGLIQLEGPLLGAFGEQLQLRPSQPLHWRNYRALEGALVGVLQQPGLMLEQRLLVLDRLLHAAAEEHGHDLAAPSKAFAAWTAALAADGYAALLADLPAASPSPMRQRAVLAPFLAALEQQWQTWGAGGGGLGTRLVLAIIITNGVGPLPLSSFEATVDQGRMNRTRFPQDDPALAQLCARYVTGLLQRKSLVDGTDVFQGFRYLLLSFAAARWYAVARATLAERPVAELDDLRQGIRTVEKGLGHAVGLRTGPTQRVVRFLFGRVGSPATMIHNYYTAGEVS